MASTSTTTTTTNQLLPSASAMTINEENAVQLTPSLRGPTAHATPAGSVMNIPDAVEETLPTTPQVYLTFLLVSGLRKAMAFDPDISISRVKELFWMAWPSDWEERPPTPSFLRILHGGKILQDDDCLSKLPFPTSTMPTQSTIVHLSIRQFSPPGAADASMKKTDPSSSTGCCSCIII